MSIRWLGGSVFFLWAVSRAGAVMFTGPSDWSIVNTNGVRKWQAEQAARASAAVSVWPGVMADLQQRKVVLLAEAVGHAVGVTTEFLLIGPQSDRAYESAAVTVATPGQIVRAIERIGIARGGCVGSRPFRFWPVGERMTASVRRLDVAGAAERPLQALVSDAEPACPILGDGGLVFTGGRWAGGDCLTDTNMPSSVIALYNAADTIFDVPFQVEQGEVYGRLKLAEALPYGTLLEIVLRPLAPDGSPRVLALTVAVSGAGANTNALVANVRAGDGELVKTGGLNDALTWMRGQSESGRDMFVTLAMDDAVTVRQAGDVARVFCMMEGKGLKLDGKTENGLYPRAFLPSEKWREREGRNPQPFELHVTADSGGALQKKLVFIEEDWHVAGLDPKLSPRDYPFEDWNELPNLIRKAGGADNKVAVLFVFAPRDLPLSAFMPGVRAVSARLPLVYVFGE